MDAENHAFFTGTVRNFEAWYKLTIKIMGEIESLRNKLVEYENKSTNSENKYKKKLESLEVLDKQIRDKKLLRDASTEQMRAELERRRNEVAEREATLKVRETQLREQQGVLDKLLAAAEAKEAVKEAAKEPEKRGPGRPALSHK
jgi:protein subunit release factor B